MLHLISEAVWDENILHRIGFSDVVVLLDDAVLRSLGQGNRAGALAELLKRARCCVLSEHLAIRGIAAIELASGIEVIDYPGLVNLTLEHSVIQTWQ